MRMRTMIKMLMKKVRRTKMTNPPYPHPDPKAKKAACHQEGVQEVQGCGNQPMPLTIAAALEEPATSNPAAPTRDQCTLMLLTVVVVFSATISTPVLLPAVAVGLIDEPRLLARTGR
jgi:hypothetical protein